MVIPDNIIDIEKYKQAKKEANKKYERHSLYKSAYIHKVYKELGGRYRNKNKKNLINKWFNEEWVQVEPYLESSKKIPCGSNNKKNKACRPLKRISKNSPITINELISKYGRENMDNRIHWEGGFISLSTIENMIKPVRYIKNLSTSLNKLRTDKKKSFIKQDDKIYAKISQDVYNKPDERKIKGYIPKLSNDEIGTYIINGRVIVGIRGTKTKQDIKTDLKLASGLLRRTDRYKRNKKFIENINRKLGRINVLTGHSLGGALAQLLGNLIKNVKIVVFNAGVGITGPYGKKKATFYVSEGDPVSVLGMFSKKDDIRIIKNMGDSILDRHGIENFIKGGFLEKLLKKKNINNNNMYSYKFNNNLYGGIEEMDIYQYIGKSTKDNLKDFILSVKPDTDNKLFKMTKPKLIDWMRDNITEKQIGDLETFHLRFPKPLRGVSFEKKLGLKKIKKKRTTRFRRI